MGFLVMRLFPLLVVVFISWVSYKVGRQRERKLQEELQRAQQLPFNEDHVNLILTQLPRIERDDIVELESVLIDYKDQNF